MRLPSLLAELRYFSITFLGIVCPYPETPLYRQLAAEGRLAVENWSIATLPLRLEAAAMGVPELPTRSLVGSTMAEENAHVFSVRDGVGLAGAPWTGAQRFARALGHHGDVFRDSLDAATPAQAAAADAAIAALPAAVAQVEGGVFHYRNACPDDGFLRLWSGLALVGAGRPAAACAELEAAVALGCAPGRVQSWLARARDDKTGGAAI